MAVQGLEGITVLTVANFIHKVRNIYIEKIVTKRMYVGPYQQIIKSVYHFILKNNNNVFHFISMTMKVNNKG